MTDRLIQVGRDKREMRDDLDSSGRSRSTKQTPWEIVRLSEHDVLRTPRDPMLIRLHSIDFFPLAIFKFNSALSLFPALISQIQRIIAVERQLPYSWKERKKKRREIVDDVDRVEKKSLVAFEKNGSRTQADKNFDVRAEVAKSQY